MQYYIQYYRRQRINWNQLHKLQIAFTCLEIIFLVCILNSLFNVLTYVIKTQFVHQPK